MRTEKDGSRRGPARWLRGPVVSRRLSPSRFLRVPGFGSLSEPKKVSDLQTGAYLLWPFVLMVSFRWVETAQRALNVLMVSFRWAVSAQRALND